MTFYKSRKGLGAAMALLSGIALVPQANADAVSDFYSGKQVAIQVGFGAGGGYDTTARIVARHLGKHIPGKPSVIVQNVPGAGSMKVANALYNTAPKNGLVLGVFSSSIAMVPLYGKRKAKFVTNKFEWIGSMHSDIQACGVWKGAGQDIKTLPDFIAAKKPIIFGSNGPTSPLTTFPLFMKNVLGAKTVKVVHGYKGTKGVNLGMQNGELNATCGMFESSVRGAFFNSYKSGDLVLYVQLGLKKKVPLFGQATNIFDLLKTEEEKKMARLVFGPSEITRPLAAPPGTPKGRVAALRKALLDTMKDPGLIADGKRIKIAFSPISGEDVAKQFDEYFATPKALVDKTYGYISKM
jgi:tripartite-type tricarboxylate transporter receptor subunit TctC